MGDGAWNTTTTAVIVTPDDGSAFGVILQAGETSSEGLFLFEGGFGRIADAAALVTGSIDFGDGRSLDLDIVLIPPGDTNLDGRVNQTDLYNVWRNIGKDPVVIETVTPDLDGDGDIDQDDLDVVMNHYLVDASTLGTGEHRFAYRAPAVDLQAGSIYDVTLSFWDGAVTSLHRFVASVDGAGAVLTVTPAADVLDVTVSGTNLTVGFGPDLAAQGDNADGDSLTNASSLSLLDATGALVPLQDFAMDWYTLKATWTSVDPLAWGDYTLRFDLDLDGTDEFELLFSVKPGNVNGDGGVDASETSPVEGNSEV